MAGVVKTVGELEVGLWSVLTGRRLRLKSGEEDEGEGSGRSRKRGQDKDGAGGEEKGKWMVEGAGPKCIRFVDVPGVGEEVWAGVGERIERFGLGKVE